MTNRIFVFGSNLAGRHGKGAANYAMHYHQAEYGRGVGRQGNSYAIPTKDERLNTLALGEIKGYVNMFISYACRHPELQFDLTPIGCGLAGYKRSQIRPLFDHAPANVNFLKEWELIDDDVE